MHKRAGFLILTGISVAAVAASTVGPIAASKQVPPVTSAAVAPIAIQAVRPPVVSSVAAEVARWSSLRQSDNLPFSAYASFLLTHRGWPGESAMRRAAERQAGQGASPSEVVRFFSAFPPLTPAGHANHAFALLASNRVDEARAAARLAWTGGVLPVDVEQRLLGAFASSFGAQEHDRRMDVLLGNGDAQSAQRTLAWSSPAKRPLFEARLSMQSRSPDAAARFAALGARALTDPGVLIDRAKWLRETGDPLGARQLLAQPRRLVSHPVNPEGFMEAMVTIARGAANDRQWTLAYGIASQVDDIFPAGTDVSARPFGDRDEYTNLTWLAGTAGRRLGRPADSAAMFERYARASQSPQSQTKGLYWAGRAAAAAGQGPRSQTFFQEAARHYDQYYGQLAAERLGLALPTPTAGLAPPSPVERQRFNAQPIVLATRYLGATGRWRDQTDFVRALAELVETDTDRLLAAQLGQEIGRPDLGVLVARQARTDGSFDYKRWGFPEVRVPPAQSRHWTMVHAIARQESLFDREAISRAGARGLMQLMPATAAETARRIGVSHNDGRLTRDPEYNVLLGSTYFARLLDQWDGNYPLAIASYNAGAGNVRRWIRENGDPRSSSVDMIDWIEQIPFFETRNYVQRVLENAVVYDLLNPERAGSPGRQRLSHYLGQRTQG